MTEENNSILLLPILSENIPAGMLKTTLPNAETDAINPTPEGQSLNGTQTEEGQDSLILSN